MSQQEQIKLYGQFLRHVIGACAALFQLVTGLKPPPIKDLLR